jgi:hypothetical protein
MPFGNHLLQPWLKVMPEAAEVSGVNAPIHEAKAVGRTHHSITPNFENGAEMNLNELQVPAESLPSGRQ